MYEYFLGSRRPSKREFERELIYVSSMRDHDNSWKILVPIWVHFGTIFEHFLGTRRLSNREFERELIFDRFWLDFGPLLGTLLGAMLGQDGSLKLCKVTFFLLFTLSLEPSLFSRLLERLADPLEARLEPFCAWFWEVFRSQNECQHRPRR